MSIPQSPSPLTNVLAAKTYNAAWFSGATKEAQITNAISSAVTDGALYVMIPANMLPYDATQVTFNSAVHLLAEGDFNVDEYNVKAYGAAGDKLQDDTFSIQTTLNQMALALPKGGIVKIPPKDYKVSSPISIPGVNLFIDSSKHTIKMQGARLFSYDTTPGRAIIITNTFIGQEGSLVFEGGTLDGSNTISGSYGVVNGFELQASNTKIDGVVVRYCNYGVTFSAPFAAPPICCEIVSSKLQLNKRGLNVEVSASNLYVHGNRIEGNGEEGVHLDNCGQVTFVGNVIETNGFITASKPQLKILNLVTGLFDGNWFESYAGQHHTCIDLEAVGTTVPGPKFTSNVITNGNSDGNALNIGINVGSTAGAVEGFTESSNMFTGQTVGVRVGLNARGCIFGPDYFSDNFDPAGLAHTKYQNNSSQPNIIYDLNRYSTTTTLGYQRTVKKIAQFVYSASITPDAGLTNWVSISANNGTPFTINAPLNPPDSTHEQELEFTIMNTSGGALGAITWNAIYRINPAFVAPANGFNRSIRFRWRGFSWVEMSRSSADIAN